MEAFGRHFKWAVPLTAAVLGVGLVIYPQAERWRLLTTGLPSKGLPGLSAITELAFVDPRNGWAVTPNAVLRTTDAGYTWNEELEANEAYYHSVAFISATTGWIVGSEFTDGAVRPLILRTVDAGRVWHKCAVNAAGGLRAVSFCNSAVGWTVGTHSILHSTDGGITWQQQFGTRSIRSLGGIACLGPRRAFAVGESGTLISTDDGGLTWREHDLGTSANLFRVRFAARDGWIVGTGGTVARTIDQGVTWQLVPMDERLLLTDVYVAGSRGWIVGSKGAVLRTKDGGTTWEQQKPLTSEDLFCLSFVNPHLGWAGGDKRTVLGTE